jgi:microcin C transport system substrate-binding protein
MTRTGAIAVSHVIFRPLLAGLMLTTGLAYATALRAQDTITAHGISTFGNLNLAPDFAHLPYVNPTAPKGGEISVAALGTFDSLNPYSVKGTASGIGSVFYESILASTADEIGAAYCLLCTTLEYPADRSWVIFNLRDDVTFSDGSPLTAEDVVFSYQLFRDKGIAEFRAVANAKFKSAEVLAPNRVKFTFAEGAPFRDMPATAGGLTILSKAHYEANKLDLEESSLIPFLGTGAYMLDSLRPGQQIILKRNADYWGNAHPLQIGRNNFDRIRVEYFGDSNAAFEGFKSGVFTFHNETSSKQWATAYDFENLNKGAAIKAELPDGSIASTQSFVFNLRRDKFQDIRVRQAIGLMFNFEWSDQTLFYGLYDRIPSFFTNTAMQAAGAPTPEEAALLQPLVDQGLLDASILTDDAILPPLSGVEANLDRKNLRAASALLDAAGWTAGADGMRANAAGEKLTVEFLNASPAFERIIAPYVENLRALGVDASLNTIDPAQFSQRVDPPNFDFDMITANPVNGYEPGGEMKQGYASITRDNSTRNRMGLADPAVDKLLDGIEAAKTRAELDLATRTLDRVLRRIYFNVPQWYKGVHTVAYYDQYGFPEKLPPYDLGNLDFWWFDQAKADKLKSDGVLK